MPNNIELSKNQINARTQMMKKLEAELKKLEFDIKHTKLANAKIKFIKSQLIILRALIYFSPYVAITAVTTILFSVLGRTPFVRDDVKCSLRTKKYLNPYDDKKYEQMYSRNDFDKEPVKYYGKWVKVEDNLYLRDVRTYSDSGNARKLIKSFENLSEEEIVDKLCELKDMSIDEVLGNNYVSTKEFRENITEEELKREPYIEVTKYLEDSNDFIILRESAEENVGITALWFVSSAMVNLLSGVLFNDVRNHDFSYYVNRINEIYPKVNVEAITKKLEIKRNNYNRLTR